MQEIGHRIRAARQRAGLTQKGLAERLGVHQSAVAHWERDDGNQPNRRAIRRLALVLGRPAAWLEFGDAEPTRVRRAVGLGGRVCAAREKGQIWIPAIPPGHEVLVVRSTTHWPVFRPGDIVVVKSAAPLAPAALVGCECLCEEPDGEQRLVLLHHGAGSDLYTFAFHAAPADPNPQTVSRAFPVRSVIRNAVTRPKLAHG